MLALIWWMYAGYAWLTNSISTRGLRQRAILLGRHGRLPRPGPRRPGRLPRQRPGLRRRLPHRRRRPRVALHLDGLRAVLARLPRHRALQPLQRDARDRRRRAGRHRAGACCGRSPPSSSGRRRGWATARARAASRSPRRTSSSATGWWSSSPSASRSWPAGSAPRGWRWTPSSILAVVLGLLLSAGLWWAYFGADDDEQAERALADAPARAPAVDRAGGLRSRALLPAPGHRPRGRRDQDGHRARLRPAGDRRGVRPRRRRRALPRRRRRLPRASWASGARRTARSPRCWPWPPSRSARRSRRSPSSPRSS